MNKIITCKECGETDLIQLNKEITTLDGIFCNQCGCFHFKLDDYKICEFYESTQIVGKYLIDHDRKLLKKENGIS